MYVQCSIEQKKKKDINNEQHFLCVNIQNHFNNIALKHSTKKYFQRKKSIKYSLNRARNISQTLQMKSSQTLRQIDCLPWANVCAEKRVEKKSSLLNIFSIR